MGALMATVYKRAEWAADTEDDPESFAAAVTWAVRGLVRLCEDIAVTPAGELTVAAKGIDELDPNRAYELQLELMCAPRFPTVPAAGARCPVVTCRTVHYGADETAATAAAARHWEQAHSAGDQFA